MITEFLNSKLFRVFYDLIFFLSIFTLPWWIVAIMAIVGLLIFKVFYEFLISAFVYENTYGASDYDFYGIPLLFIAAGLIFVIIFYVKKQSKFSN
ncbi:MAG: hypothetical protein COV70_00985 [Parcubacteria group bacterium CG11_big_fil_rev_8_21_14_0_20_39_22]|nr:MAG: hypothetical protein COV70_00985 [Parcubacteria group bacterium CG11_big_fil_rev_8_21_14_0_20_39_22]